MKIRSPKPDARSTAKEKSAEDIARTLRLDKGLPKEEHLSSRDVTNLIKRTKRAGYVTHKDKDFQLLPKAVEIFEKYQEVDKGW